MDSFPLNPFLLSLAADSIRVTIRDYERIGLVLRTGRPWTVTRLRDTLLALLAKDENQREIFLRRFNDFFRLQLDAEGDFADLDLKRALAELEQLAQEQPAFQKPRLAVPSRPRRTVEKTRKKPRFRFELWMTLPIVLIIGMLVTIGYVLWPHPESPLPPFSLNPTVLNFGNQSVGDTSTQEFALTNNGSSALSITPVITGPHASDFSLAADYVGQSVPAGDSLTITVSFAPASAGSRIASLDITTNVQENPQRVALSGTGIVADSTIPPAEQKRLYSNVPYVKSIEYLPRRSADWQRYAAIAAFFLLAVLLHGLYLWRSRKIPEDEAAHWEKERPRHFPLGAIGGKPPPHLDDEILNQLADCMGYFQGEQGGRVLNVPASIEATMRRGGIPTLEFYKRRQIRSLLILEDAFAEAIVWNPIARELAEGMQQRGVPVLYGRFNGSPGQFKTEDGAVYHLEDLEDQRRGYLLLIFTDGKSLYDRHEGTFALEALARWPMVVWMELREPHFWDETSMLPPLYGIPIYPATPTGMVRAIQRFLTEQAAEPDFSEQAINWQDVLEQTGTNVEAYIEELLGDALVWAQGCAMLQPITPITPGLADALRQEFHPHLPAERIERLYALPGAQHSVSGLRFSDEVLKVLREGFLIRRSEREQENVLRFLLREIEEVEPGEEDSLAHLAWESVRERVRLELDQDNDLARLAQLAKTPLGGAITASLENFGFPDQTDRIPLRLKPRNKYALQRLARMAEGFHIPKLEAYPVVWRHWLALGLMVALFWAFIGLGIQSYLDVFPFNIMLVNSGLVALDDLILILEGEGETYFEWPIPRLEPGSSVGTDVVGMPEGEYSVKSYGSGHYGKGYLTTIANDSALLISSDVQDVEHDCRETFPDVGLIVKRCPDFETSVTEPIQLTTWREQSGEAVPENRLMSVGLEIFANKQDDALLQHWHNTLLRTSSVDVLYRIQPGSDDEWHIDEAFEQLQVDLGPLIGRSQLIWWGVGQTPYGIVIEESLPAFDRMLKLGEGEDLSWLAMLESLFEPNENMLITEEDILTALGQTQPVASGAFVTLFRPSLTTGTLVVSAQPVTATITVASADGATSQTGSSGDRFELTTGQWQIKAEAEGYEPAVETVEITEGQEQDVTLILEVTSGPTTLAATSAPTLTPTGTLTPTPKPDTVVNAENLNLRSGPGTDYDVLGVLRQGDRLKITGRNLAGDWLKVIAPDGQEGWTVASSLQVNVDIAGVPVAQAPSTPTLPVPPTSTPMAVPTATPALPIVAGKIAFPVFDPQRGTYDILIANADGADRRKFKEEASQPCFNPDGTQIAYRSWRNYERGLRVADTSSGDDLWTITTVHEASRPSFSMGGIAYHLRPEPNSRGTFYLFPGGGEPKVMKWANDTLHGESPAWVSGWGWVYKGCIEGACGLYLTDCGPSYRCRWWPAEVIGLTQITTDVNDTNPEASPDGKKVAFMSRRDDNWEVCVVDLDTRQVKRLTDNGANDGLPIWSPDGQTIAFASDRSGEWAVWAMSPDGSNQRMLFPLGGSLDGYVRHAQPHEGGGWVEERLSWSP